jgi:hypothetical protein
LRKSFHSCGAIEKQVEALLAERDLIRAKVEAMLDAVAALDPEMAEELR